jgi:hypothetical protein
MIGRAVSRPSLLDFAPYRSAMVGLCSIISEGYSEACIETEDSEKAGTSCIVVRIHCCIKKGRPDEGGLLTL